MKAVELAKKYMKKYFDNLEHYLKIIKELLPNCKIYLFGSVLTKDYHPMLSDIDVAIVSNNMSEDANERVRIRLKLLESFEFSPFEIHIIKTGGMRIL